MSELASFAEGLREETVQLSQRFRQGSESAEDLNVEMTTVREHINEAIKMLGELSLKVKTIEGALLREEWYGDQATAKAAENTAFAENLVNFAASLLHDSENAHAKRAVEHLQATHDMAIQTTEASVRVPDKIDEILRSVRSAHKKLGPVMAALSLAATRSQNATSMAGQVIGHAESAADLSTNAADELEAYQRDIQ